MVQIYRATMEGHFDERDERGKQRLWNIAPAQLREAIKELAREAA